MRGLTLLLLVSFLLAGCDNAPSPASHAALPPATLDMIPSPSQLGATGSGSEPAPSAKFSSVVQRIYGDDYSDAMANAQVTRNAATNSCTLSGQPGSMAFCIYELIPGTFTEGVLASGILLESEWLVEPPLAPDGLWVGVPDYVRDRWVWVGPVSEEAVWFDLSTYELFGRVGETHLVAVNCAASEVELHTLNLDVGNGAPEQDASWLYYTRYDEENPALGTSIVRLQPGLASPPEVVLQGTLTASYFCPQIFRSAGEYYLLYALNDSGDNEVWSAELDGANPQPLCMDAGRNYLPGDYNWYTGNNMYLELNAQGRYNLYATEFASGTTGLFTRPQDLILHVTWNDSTAADFAAIFSLRVDGPPVRSVIAYASAWGLPPFAAPPEVLIDNGSESAMMPSYFVLTDSFGHGQPGIVFTSRGRDCERYALYWYAWQGAIIDEGTLRTLAVDPALDLISPAVSPRGYWLAYIAKLPAADRGTLYMTDFLTVTNPASDATALDTNVTGQMACVFLP